MRACDGIILMDAIFDDSVEDEVVNGLTALPSQINFVVISHAHGNHVGGAGFLQKRGARIVMSAADWDLSERANVNDQKPRRDIVATDGQKLTLGDTTVTLSATPGHTLGTISSLIPVRDGNRRHVAAYWGGTAFNWSSAQRFRDAASRAGAAGGPHPCAGGKDAVRRYLTFAEECAQAGLSSSPR